LKTFCGEVSVLLLVFPFLDWYLGTNAPERVDKFRLVKWSPLLALAFLIVAIGSSQLEKKYEKIEKEVKQ